MSVQLTHTIGYASDPGKAARFLAKVLGRSTPVRFGHFEVVELDNGVSLDFAAVDGPIQPQHYAFLVSEAEFDAIFERIREQNLEYWADPRRQHPVKSIAMTADAESTFPAPMGTIWK